MTDKELLELAAKAAGIVSDGLGNCFDIERDEIWDSLTDRGDALRLAATLRLRVLPGKHPGDGCTVEAQQPGIPSCTAFHDDPSEQMCRAITRVAASIGAAL